MFIGQNHIIHQLDEIIIPAWKAGQNMSILLRGPSGYGKTRLGLMICNVASGGKFELKIPEKGKITINESLRFHFIDEIHTLTEPEFLYPLIDSGAFSFIFATNEDGKVKEPLLNRCVNLVFIEYSQEELRELTRVSLSESGMRFTDSMVDKIIEVGNRNPREITSISKRVSLYVRSHPLILRDDFDEMLKSLFGFEDGMDLLSRVYLQKLKELGGKASLDALSRTTHIDKTTMTSLIEPSLLYRGEILISSKGRSLR